MNKTFALAAACATALSPILAAPAFAQAAPSTATLTTMTNTCANLVTMNFGTTTPGNYTYYSVVVDSDGGTDGDPVFLGNRVNDASTWTPDETSTKTLNGADASQSTALIRNGKSPNIFATDVRASSVTWSNNSVEFDADYTITTTFEYGCDVTQHEWNPPVPGTFTYTLREGSPANDDCSRFDNDVNHPNYGSRIGNCVPTVNQPPQAGFHTENNLGVQGAFTVTQDRIENLRMTDENAGPHTYFDTNELGHAVVCISPGSKGGEWRAQNSYGGLGGACSTAKFLSLPPGGSIPSNSLPVT
jgi:hypothetical protein